MNQFKKIISMYFSVQKPGRDTQDRFNAWLASPRARAEKDAAMQEEWEKAFLQESSDSVMDRNLKLEKLHERFLLQEKDRKRGGLFLTWPRVAVAAAVVALCLVGQHLYYHLGGREIPGTICLVTSPQDKGFFTLPDGSTVWLNASSRLSYTDHFGSGKERSVILEGEGFFDVAKDGRPFTVQAGDMAVTVLGTKFGVRHSPYYTEDQVTLQSGKVSVRIAGSESTVLSPGDQLRYNAVEGSMQVVTVDTPDYTSWTGNTLVFDHTPLSEVLVNLEHWYSVSFSVASGLDLDKRLSFKVPKEPIEETLRLLAFLTEYKYMQLDAHSILLTSK